MMHETSIVRSLLSQVVRFVEPSPASSVRLVRIALGPLSGVEPVLVRQAFERLKTGLGMSASQLSINEVPLTAECRECELTFEVADFVFRCPNCHSSSVRVTQGDALTLLSIEVEETPCVS